MNIIKEKFYLYKQRECIRAIKFVLDGHSQYVFNTANGFLDYHKEFMIIKENNYINDPLISLKHYYYKDLEYRRLYIKTANEDEYEEIEKIINGDIAIIRELSDEFMNRYYKVISSIKYIAKNKKYLTDEQNQLFLVPYYKAMRISNNKQRVRSVK